MSYTVGQEPVKKVNDKKQGQIALRLTQPEIDLLEVIVSRVRSRNRHMDRSKVLREIIGFDPPTFVTDEDRAILRGDTTEGEVKRPPKAVGKR